MGVAMVYTNLSPVGRALQPRIDALAHATAAESDYSAGVCVCGGDEPKRTLKLLTAVARGMVIVDERYMHVHTASDNQLHSPLQYEQRAHATRRLAGGALKGVSVAFAGPTTIPRAQLAELLFAAGAITKRAPLEFDAGPLLVHWAGVWRRETEARLLAAIMDGRYEHEDEEGGTNQAAAMATHEPASNAENQPPVGDAGPAPASPAPSAVPAAAARAKRSRRSSSPASAAGCTELPLAGTGPSQQQPPVLHGRMLPAQPAHSGRGSGSQRGGGASSEGSSLYFLLEDALRLYRARLPNCNVLLVQEGRESRDFLQELVDAPLSRTALLQKRDGDESAMAVGACTFVLHPPPLGLCELQLLAVSGRHARRGYGTLLLRSVEAWLLAAGAKSIVVLAGMDTVAFWQRRGFVDEVSLAPEAWALLRDPFGSSTMLAKNLQSGTLGTD